MFRIDEQVSRSDQMSEHVPAFDLLHEAGDDNLFFSTKYSTRYPCRMNIYFR